VDNFSIMFFLSLCGTVYGPISYLMAVRKEKMMTVSSSDENKAGEIKAQKARGEAFFISGVIGVIVLSPIMLGIGGPLLFLLAFAIYVANLVWLLYKIFSAQKHLP